MAGLTKTGGISAMPTPRENCMRDPRHLPMYASTNANTPSIVTSSGAISELTGSTGWTAFSNMGSHQQRGQTNDWGDGTGNPVNGSTFSTILNVVNADTPIIMANAVGCMATSNSAHAFRITIDGIVYTVGHDYANFTGRLVLGALNMESSSTTNGRRGIKQGFYSGIHGITAGSWSNASTVGITNRGFYANEGVLDSPLDMYINGRPVLYADHSLKVEFRGDNPVSHQYQNYFGCTWCYLNTKDVT